jgi:hypothetical protein
MAIYLAFLKPPPPHWQIHEPSARTKRLMSENRHDGKNSYEIMLK